VLPFGAGGVGYGEFRERASWWEVNLTESGTADPGASNPGTAHLGTAGPSQEKVEDAGDAPHHSGRPESSSAEPTVEAGQPGSAGGTDSVLSSLGEIIAERHRTMPEGSYTTHLFSKGAEKIRKKVGEEAVEFILAAEPDQIRSEGADLIYHMMVLLESEGLRMEQVFAELDRRHRKG
jgi:phosphoribosyl-ATP pyrophosphohydrolase